MTFPTIVFGSGIIDPTSPGRVQYTDGSSISAGGYRLFIVPIVNIGGSGIDFGFTYVNQFGQTKTTTVTTPVGAFTTAGTHVEVVLEPGDTGIQDLISVTAIGGINGNSLSFESWNEGSGAPARPISNSSTFDRSLPGAHLEPIFIRAINVKLIDRIASIPILYYTSPAIQIPVPLERSIFITNIPEIMINRNIVSKDFIKERADRVDWSPDPYGIRIFDGKSIQNLKSWLESVVGQVTSGYIQNINGKIINNAFILVLISPPSDVNPAGVTTTSDVNPNTGLYQAFLKKVVYDKRYIMVKIGIKNIALEGAGTPVVVDGNQQLPIPYSLQFACPVKDCDFIVTRKVT